MQAKHSVHEAPKETVQTHGGRVDPGGPAPLPPMAVPHGEAPHTEGWSPTPGLLSSTRWEPRAHVGGFGAPPPRSPASRAHSTPHFLTGWRCILPGSQTACLLQKEQEDWAQVTPSPTPWVRMSQECSSWEVDRSCSRHTQNTHRTHTHTPARLESLELTAL